MNTTLKYYIGELYRYPNSKKMFKLKETSGMIFKFECGHWCTDTVFADLIRVKTSVQVCDDVQLELFL